MEMRWWYGAPTNESNIFEICTEEKLLEHQLETGQRQIGQSISKKYKSGKPKLFEIELTIVDNSSGVHRPPG